MMVRAELVMVGVEVVEVANKDAILMISSKLSFETEINLIVILFIKFYNVCVRIPSDGSLKLQKINPTLSLCLTK